MSTIALDSFRKYSCNVSLHEAIDQLNIQLHRLYDNTEIHYSKRKKVLLQLEQKNNQYRRSIDRSDLENKKILTNNTELIQHIKRKITDEDRQQRQRRRNEREQMENNRWSLGGMTALIVAALAGIISAATFIIMILDNSKKNIFNTFCYIF